MSVASRLSVALAAFLTCSATSVTSGCAAHDSCMIASPPSNMAGHSITAFISERARAAYWGMLIGDALAAPAHWYYNPRDIVREFGRITDFVKPPAKHPSSILNLSSTGTGGRGSQEGNIVGDVILHGKKHLWLVPGTHYHGTLAAGENTLNAQVARLLVRTLTRDAGYDSGVFLKEYVTFMTTPGSHNDTYAETYHRSECSAHLPRCRSVTLRGVLFCAVFFKNYVKGVPPASCAEDDGHNVASMGGFVMLPPVALLATATAMGAGHAGATVPTDAPADVLAAARKSTVQHMYTTHNSASLERRAGVYAELLARVALGGDLRACVKDAGKRIGVDIPAVVAAAREDTSVIGGTFSSACYIEHSFPALLYLAYKYAHDPEAAVIACVNVGGENAHRAAALGALMGAAHGMKAWPSRWIEGLHAKDDIAKEAAAFGELVATKAPAAHECCLSGNTARTVGTLCRSRDRLRRAERLRVQGCGQRFVALCAGFCFPGTSEANWQRLESLTVQVKIPTIPSDSSSSFNTECRHYAATQQRCMCHSIDTSHALVGLSSESLGKLVHAPLLLQVLK